MLTLDCRCAHGASGRQSTGPLGNMERLISTSLKTGSGCGQRLLVLSWKLLSFIDKGGRALNGFKVVDCLPNLLLQWSPREHWRSAEDLLLQALPQPGKVSSPPSFVHIFEYFKSRCWRQSSWMGSQWRATMPGASLTTLSEWKEGEKAGETIMSIVNQVGDGLHREVWSPLREPERSS